MGGLDISIQLLLPDPFCILAMNFMHKKNDTNTYRSTHIFPDERLKFLLVQPCM